MNENILKRNRLLAEQLMRAFESRNMKACYAETKEEARKKALEWIPEGSTVTWGGSMSIEEIGLKDALLKGNYQVFDCNLNKTQEERKEIYRKAFTCDFFLSSANAVSEDGVIVNIDGNANRVAAIAYGPENVLMIVGMNKVVKIQEDAMRRAKHIAAPMNAQRFGGKTPCTATGSCGDCKSPDCVCCQTLVTRYSRVKDRIKIILVNDNLGF